MNDTFANRLQKALDKNKMKPSELANKTGLDKSLISNYLSGNYKAKQNKLTILAKVLNVNEIWLMGYDVPEDSNYEGVIHDDDQNGFYFRFNPQNEGLKEENNEPTLMEQYRILFDKDNALTQEQKNFMINFLEDQHKKIDNNERIDD